MRRLFHVVSCACLSLAIFNSSVGGAAAQTESEAVAIAEAVPTLSANAAPEADKPSPAKFLDSEKKVRPLTVSVNLLRESVITGALTDSTQLVLKTAFGEASIPLSEVAGVRFPTGQDTSTTVVMLNGDSITGASDVKSITVDTEWGTAKINGQNISSMQFVPGLEWQNVNGLNGQRWSLVEARVPTPAPQTARTAPGAPNLPSGAAPGNNGPNGQVVPAGAAGRPQVIFGQ